MQPASETIRDLRDPTKALRRAIPGVYEGFSAMHDAALQEGALDAESKELIALAIAVVKGCSACIAYHARALAKLGANAEEVAEALGVAVMMDGGPASSGYGPEAYAAFLEFARELQPAGVS